MSKTEWRIASRERQCCRCERVFADGDPLFSALQFATDTLERVDFCSPCFEERDEGQDLFWWRTRHAESSRGMQVDFDMLLQVIASLDDAKDDERLDLRFLLALLLVRHRRLRLVGVSGSGAKERLRLRKPRTKKEFLVAVRDLSSERRQRLIDKLSGLLDPTIDSSAQDLLADRPPDADETEVGEAPEQ